ncbi:MAG TPA: hypothetical protein DCQ06_05355 [Myxococcales bacterium]|nr:hypothetical protein [Myxococcales bacterium]
MKKLMSLVIAFGFVLSIAASAFAADYPTEVNKRPLTLPGGTWSASADIGLSNSFESIGMGLKGAYAVNDEVQINLGYNLALQEFELGKGLDLGVNYGVLNDGNFRLAPSMSLPLNFGDGDTLPVINIGVDARFNLMNDKLALYFGHDLLQIGIADGQSGYAINIPVGAGYQINANINLRLDLWLATIADGNTTSIADATPVTLTGVYAISNKMDVGMRASMDAQNAGDTLSIGMMFAYRGL